MKIGKNDVICCMTCGGYGSYDEVQMDGETIAQRWCADCHGFGFLIADDKLAKLKQMAKKFTGAPKINTGRTDGRI